MKKKTFSVRLNPDVHAAAKGAAGASHKTLEQYIEEALIRALPPQFRTEPKKAKVAGK